MSSNSVKRFFLRYVSLWWRLKIISTFKAVFFVLSGKSFCVNNMCVEQKLITIPCDNQTAMCQKWNEKTENIRKSLRTMPANRFHSLSVFGRDLQKTHVSLLCILSLLLHLTHREDEEATRWKDHCMHVHWLVKCKQTFFLRYLNFLSQQCKGRSSLFKLLLNFCIVALCGLFLITQLYKHSSTPSENFESKTEALFQRRPVVLPVLSAKEFHYVEPANSFFKQKHNVLRTKVDWHNWTHVQQEKDRKGPGEQGKAFRLRDPKDIEKNNELLRVNGYWAVASDIISVNRSVSDIRHPL